MYFICRKENEAESGSNGERNAHYQTKDNAGTNNATSATTRCVLFSFSNISYFWPSVTQRPMQNIIC